jgi:hypothetical protein
MLEVGTTRNLDLVWREKEERPESTIYPPIG